MLVVLTLDTLRYVDAEQSDVLFMSYFDPSAGRARLVSMKLDQAVQFAAQPITLLSYLMRDLLSRLSDAQCRQAQLQGERTVVSREWESTTVPAFIAPQRSAQQYAH